MLSVLIPVYNDDVRILVHELHKQLCAAQIPFEIAVLDDGSKPQITELNQTITYLPKVTFRSNNTNQGRTKTRHELAKNATYSWLLFLDADVAIKNHLIDNYLPYISDEKLLVYGGFCYEENNPNPKYSLRHTFGKHREDQKAQKRRLHPYKTIISANILVEKSIFTGANSELKNTYGLDYLFSAYLKNKNIKVVHIDNEVVHLGLERNVVFLKKSEAAVTALLEYHNKHSISTTDISLLNAYKKVQKWKLKPIVAMGFKIVKPFLRKNLKGSRPSLFVFDCYRLGFMCTIKTKV